MTDEENVIYVKLTMLGYRFPMLDARYVYTKQGNPDAREIIRPGGFRAGWAPDLRRAVLQANVEYTRTHKPR